MNECRLLPAVHSPFAIFFQSADENLDPPLTSTNIYGILLLTIYMWPSMMIFYRE